jgi:hypothetical protein
MKVYNEFGELDVNGELYYAARAKVKDTIKGFKSKVCTKIIVSLYTTLLILTLIKTAF